jgi:hypothetical protein
MSVSDNGSRERLCAQLKTLGKIPNNTKTNSDDEKDEKDKNAASPSTTSLGVGVIALVAAAVMLF